MERERDHMVKFMLKCHAKSNGDGYFGTLRDYLF